MDYYKRKWSCG